MHPWWKKRIKKSIQRIKKIQKSRQYKWVKVSINKVSAAHLDRNYVSKQLSSQIIPMGFTDHNLVLIIIRKSQSSNKSSFGLKIKNFVGILKYFCNNGKWKKKSNFENLRQWWDIWKVNIKMFCLQYTAKSTKVLRETIESVEN